ncbi:MAG: carboxylate--amine ligase [Haloarculaceae archaeon]
MSDSPTDTTGRQSVLIPTGIEMKSYGCIRSLNRHGIHTIVASDREWIPHFCSRYCSEQVRLPSHEHHLVAYKDGLLDVAARPDVKTIIPVRECDTYIFAKYADEFAEHVSLVSPPLETLRNAHDRLRLAQAAASAGVPHAETRRLSDVEEWTDDVVVKARYNVLTSDYVDSMGPHEVEEVNDVRFCRAGTEPDADALVESMHHEPIVQAYIPEADKHLYCALWDRGEPLVTYQHRQIRKVSWVGGGGVYRESVRSQAVEEAAYDLLSHLDWHGFACIEYVKDERTGEWKFLEINPRVWHSLPEAVRAGVDFPYHYWLATQGEADRIETGYDTGITCHTSYGELKHLLSLLYDESPFLEPPSFTKQLAEVAISCVTHPRFDYIRADDPRFLLSAARALSGISVGDEYESDG